VYITFFFSCFAAYIIQRYKGVRKGGDAALNEVINDVCLQARRANRKEKKA
jgi:hypothetical protein